MHDHHDHSHPAHDHSHPVEVGEAGRIDFPQKLIRRLEHWRHHNEDHLDGYRQWVQSTAANGYGEVSALLEQILDLSRQITERLDRALAGLEGGGPRR
jgi:hypothetical protein